MGVYIKGMEMPPRCGRCDMRIPAYDGGMFECCITAAIIDNLGEKMEDCPLVPVPPHGRLIDADALLARFDKESSAADAHGRDFSTCFMRGLEPCAEWWAVEQIVMDAPTIVPGEEDEP